MNLDYLDNKIPQRWLLLLCYYLPFCNLLSFYIRPSSFYFKCRTFINELKHSGQKDFPLAQLPNFLYLLEKYSFKETEKKLANEIISEILIKDHNKFKKDHLIAFLARFDPDDKSSRTPILNNALEHIPSKFYAEYLSSLNPSQCTLRDLKWCVRLKIKLKLEDRLALTLSLPNDKLMTYQSIIFPLVGQECNELLNPQFGLNKFLSAHIISQLLEFIFIRNPRLIFSATFIQTLLSQLLEIQDPLLTSRILKLDISERFTFFENFLVNSENFQQTSHHFLSFCQEDQCSAMIDHLINCVFNTQEAAQDETLQEEKKLTLDSWKNFLLTKLLEGSYRLSLFQFLAIQTLTKKQLDLEKLKQLFNTCNSPEQEKNFSLACQSSVVEYSTLAIKTYIKDNFMIHVHKENTRHDIHRAFYRFFNNEYTGKPLNVSKLILKKLPEHLQATYEIDLNFLQQLLSQLYLIENNPSLVEFKNKRWMAWNKAQREYEEISEARRELLQRIHDGLQSSVSYQRMNEIFGSKAQIVQEKWKQTLGVHFFDANDKEERKLALQDAAKIIQFKREYNDTSSLGTSPMAGSYFS